VSVVISKIIGGLGNQMFQYACGRALSISRHLPFLLDIEELEKRYKLHNGYELDRVFNISVRQANNVEMRAVLGWQGQEIARRLLSYRKVRFLRGKNYILESNSGYCDIENVPSSCYLVGYWQSEKYFSKFSREIKNDFSFKNKLSGRNLESKRDINECNSICVHVRRGDYVNNPNTFSVHGVCSLDYYSSAIKYIYDHIPAPIFFVFSDDLEWAKNNLKFDSPAIFVDQNANIDSHFDLQLMSLCKHHIIANSSFSWWGAPRYWFSKKEIQIDLIPKEWIVL
jgi:hypothetical protein